jgi:hypothetical protein
MKGLLIFDFDLTLSKHNLFTKYGDYLDTSLWNENKVRQFQLEHFSQFDEMKRLFHLLVDRLGYRICVASFGYQHMIEKYIAMTYGYDLIKKEDIVGTNGIGSNKNHIIKYFMKKYMNGNNKNVVFFDDDPNNIKEAMKLCRAIWINPGGTLNVKMVSDVVEEYYKEKYLQYKKKYLLLKNWREHGF